MEDYGDFGFLYINKTEKVMLKGVYRNKISKNNLRPGSYERKDRYM